MSEPARLLYLINDAAFFLSHRLALANAARAAGYDVHVATPEDAASAEIQVAGFPLHVIPLSRKGIHPWHEIAAFRSILSLYRRLQPRLVHQVTIKPVIYGGLAARISGVPAVVSAVTGLGYVFVTRGWKAVLLQTLVKRAYRWALCNPHQRVIFQNPDDLSAFADFLPAPQMVTIKGSGVDMGEFSPRPEEPGPPLVVLAGRMLWDKGIGEFVAAADMLREAGVAARFALVGGTDSGNRAAVPAEQLDAWSAAGVVEWWGHRDDMPEVFRQAHIVCLPSYREGLPKVLVEAAACARPLVATDVPGCREIVRNEQNGLLVPPRDPTALAAALRRLIEQPELRRSFGARGRQIAAQEFSLDRVIGDTLAVYRDLLAAPASAS
jgi:glycosyltransferase involved in cell wall biosynthesis